MADESPVEASQRQRLSVGSVSIVLWVLLIAVLAYWWSTSTPHTGPTVAAPAVATPTMVAPIAATPAAANVREAALAALIAERTEELSIKPKTAIVPSDLALEAANQIKQGDYARASQIAEDVLAHSTLESWRFYPFNDFMGSIVRGADPQLLKQLDSWVDREPKSALAHLIRARYYEMAGWAARGNEYASMVPDRLMQVFQEDLTRAAADAQVSIDLNPRNPWSHYELLHLVLDIGDTGPAADQAFESAIKAFPGHYPFYKSRLHSLSPKWYGSIDAMYAFVEQYAGHAPSTSPLKMLYLDLYANLLDDAGSRCSSYNGDSRQLCVKDRMQRALRPNVDQGMAQALELYKASDPIQFSTALWPLLGTMACGPCIGSPAAVGGVLQMAASVMGSDNQMMDNPTHNSYVLDDVTARVWAQMDNPSNADKKFREALSDVEHTSFPDEAQKAATMATIFDHMATVADDKSQFIDIIVYADAANTVGGKNHTSTPWMQCYAYYRLRHFTEAVRACNTLIEGHGNYLESHYWRGKAYEGLGQWDASIADFSPVAESANNWFRVGAALDMSYDYGQKGDFAGQLASMNQHPYLFDDRIQPPHDLAVSYNNRCFALMQLGQLEKALDDCTRSLKYDRIPDALHKQQELLKRLGKKESV
jgi:tetratricopeptide (TPR) repeat protein